jgi:hypothetical protein
MGIATTGTGTIITTMAMTTTITTTLMITTTITTTAWALPASPYPA